MKTKLKFSFPLALLIHVGADILNALAASLTAHSKRLKPEDLAAGRTLLTRLTAETAAHQLEAGKVGGLTQVQNAALDRMLEKYQAARDTAKKAFPTDKLKQRQQFQVGVNQPHDLGSVLGRARIVLAGCAAEANAPGLATQGWIAEDTAELGQLIQAVETADDTQEDAKLDAPEVSEQRNRDANDLYDLLVRVQNAVNLQWPASKPENAKQRALFKLDTFPPRDAGSEPSTPPPPTPQN